MSFYKKLKDDEDTEFSEESNLEEQYQKMFKKIARDFITREDFKHILREVLEELLFDNDQELDFKMNALLRAKEYKDNLKKAVNKRKTYKDVDELDWIFGNKNEQR